MDFLQDPKGDRQVKSLKPPPHRSLNQELLFPPNFKGKPNWKLLRDHLQREGRIKKEDLIYIINQCNKIMKSEGNVIYIDDPVTIVGDIHGQFYDFLKILELGGSPDVSKYLFLGDFVDRGSFSIEVIALLYAMKVYYPNRVFLLRGNHECRQLTSFFNFKDECKYKYDQEIYEIFMDSFDNMPLASVVNGRFLCLHGGVSPELRTLIDIDRLDRFKEPPRQGLFCDILWADPIENEDLYPDVQFKGNDVRGCSWVFGEKALEPILEQNNLICVIRAHEAQLEGFRMYKWTEDHKEFPQVLTIFSAPNYCDVYNNKGAILKFQNGTLNIQQYVYTAHPYLLPHFLDIFTWSIPFVSEKITEMLYYMITPKPEDNEEIEDEFIDDQKYQKFQRQFTAGSQLVNLKLSPDIIKNKIKFVARMMKMQRTLREEHENIVKLKNLCSDNRIPRGVLIDGADAIKDAIVQFNSAKQADMINEKRPDLEQLQMKTIQQQELYKKNNKLNNLKVD